MERTILHADFDCFYASVEMLYQPKLRQVPMAVGGDPEERHGIILAKNYLAKQYGVKTGEPLNQALAKCPNLSIVPPDFPKYRRFSRMARQIYEEYTDRVEPFGLDESWLDVSHLVPLREGEHFAKKLQKRLALELGLPVSIGVSWNKIYAKLGSDYNKPCGIAVFTPENYQQLIYPLPVSDLLMVGSATERKLAGRGIHTIGDLAGRDPGELTHWLGKMGQTLFLFANGLDQTPVARKDDPQTIKSIGNSTTTSRDLVCEQDVSLVFWVLAECVARRMRAQKLKGRLVSIQVRDKTLSSFTRQHQRKSFTNLASELEADALALFRANYHWSQPIRSVGLSVGDFDRETVATQLEFFTPEIRREKEESVERTVDVLKQRFGNASIGRAALLLDPPLTGFNPYEDHTIHPVGYRPQNNRDGG